MAGLPVKDDCSFPWFVFFNEARDEIVCRADYELAKEIKQSQRANQLFTEAVGECIWRQANARQITKPLAYLVL